MTKHRRISRDRCAFTLIELLVVVSIIGLLIAIMLPALGAARDAVRTSQCLSNQRQMMTGWYGVLAETNGRIPHTVPYNPTPGLPDYGSWWRRLSEQFPGLSEQSTWLTVEPDSPLVCPTIESEFNGPWYGSHMFGYSVNSRWSGCGAVGEHARKNWDSIPSPSDYPWFADPELLDHGTFTTRGVFGKPVSADWGLSFQHKGEMGNAVYADGHASSSTISILDEKGACDTPKWMLAVD